MPEWLDWLITASACAVAVVTIGVMEVNRRKRWRELTQGPRKPRKHKHDWRFHSSVFNPPEARLTKVRNMYPADMLVLLHGFTNITYTCADEDCPEVRVEQHPGKVSNPYQGTEYKA